MLCFTINVTYFQLRGTAELLGLQLGQEGNQVIASEGPLKRLRGLLVSHLEGEQPILEFAQRCEVVRRDHLALDDREIDLDLVQPAGVYRSMNGHDVVPVRSKKSCVDLAAMQAKLSSW